MGTMKAAELHRIVSEASNFVSTDDTLPALGILRIEIEGDKIVAAATDRFTLGLSKAEYWGTVIEGPGEGMPDSGEDWTFGLHPDERKALLNAAKTPKAKENWREVAIKRAENGFVVFEFTDGPEIRLREADNDFPKYKQLFPTPDMLDTSLPANVSGFDAKLLAKFAKISDGGNGKAVRAKFVQIRLAPREGSTVVQHKPTVVTIGQNFVGLIMNIKVENEENGEKLAYPAWF